ncbi:uncharacterized protein A4U43_C08F19790 [Asparagus officinalis]|nr:uncharacterized protein A4U43_C08F19790 [Asparagus officinalis]
MGQRLDIDGEEAGKKNIHKGSYGVATQKSCQLQFGSYCLWSQEHKEVMKYSLVKRMKDQVFVARAYHPIFVKLKDENSTVYIDTIVGKKELSYRVEKNGDLVNASTGQKSDILIEIPAKVRSDAAQSVKKMKIAAGEDEDEVVDEENMSLLLVGFYFGCTLVTENECSDSGIEWDYMIPLF